MSEGEVSVGAFIGFLREKKSIWLIAVILVLGVALMLFGREGTANVSGNDTEARVRELCEHIDGVYNVHVMIRFEGENTVGGIAVVCDGGDTPGVKLKLTEVLCSLFNIPSGSVCVIGGK